MQSDGVKQTNIQHNTTQALKVSQYLSSNPHGLVEVGGSDRKNHELLHGQLVSSMAATIDDVKGLQRRRRH